MIECKCKPFEKGYEFSHEQRATVTCVDVKSSTKYIYENKCSNHLTKYRVDGCLIADANAKCDYLLLNCEKKKSFFIELKGSDLIKACEQVDRTIDLLKNKINDFTIHARIVLTRVNTIDLRDSKYLKLENKVRKLHGDLKKQSRQLIEINDY